MFALSQLRISPTDRYVREPPGLGGMSKPQRLFHQDQSRKRLLRAANQIGKTRAGAFEAWCHACGEHPYRTVPEPGNEGWVLCSDLRNGWPSISRKLREIEPPGAVSLSTSYDNGRGYYYRGIRAIQLNNGSLILGKGSDQSVLALASGTVDWQWVDELPKQSHWAEFISRGAVRSAPLFVTLTPIGRPASWLRSICEGDPHTGNAAEEPGWSIHVAKLTLENCPHRTQADLDAQIASVPSWERSIRIAAGWDSITIARRVPGFTYEGNVFNENSDDHPLDKLTSIGLGCDFGEVVGNTIHTLVGYQESSECLYVLGEGPPSERRSPAEEARGLADNLLRPWGLDYTHVEYFRGDSNSAGRRSIAVTCNQLLERAIADLMNSSVPVVQCRPPFKGPGTVLSRARLLSNACLLGKLMIHESCTRTIESLRHWSGANDRYKHPFDALAYVADCYLGLTAYNPNKATSYTIIR